MKNNFNFEDIFGNGFGCFDRNPKQDTSWEKSYREMKELAQKIYDGIDRLKELTKE